MAFLHGKNTAVLVDGFNLSAYFNEAEITAATDTHETTMFGASAKAYAPGLMDGGFSFAGLFDGADDAVDEILAAALASSSVKIVSVALAGLGSVGLPAKLAQAHQTSYDVSASVADLVATSAELPATGGVFSGVVVGELATRTATANGSTVDGAASSARGYVANLHVVGITGASASLTAKIQHSVDGSTWVDLVSFAAKTAVGAEQVSAASGTVNRYTRIVSTISGTTPNITYAITLSRR